MSAFQQLLRRWGFVKLGDYGLVLTPEGRVVSTRPGVLDDGSGGRVVGWADDDLAMAELKPWEPARPAPRGPAKPVAPVAVAPVTVAPVAVAPVTVAPVTVAPAAVAPAPVTVAPAPPAPAPAPTLTARLAAEKPVYPQVISESSVMAQAQPYDSVQMLSEQVAEEAPAEEDDWEWTIALARARAEGVEPMTAKPARPATRPGSNPPASRPAIQLAAVKPTPAKATAIMQTVAPPAATPPSPPPAAPTRAMGAVTAVTAVPTKDPAASAEWPQTEPIDPFDIEDVQVPTRTSVPLAATSPTTARHAAAPPAPPRRTRPTTAPPPAAPSLPRIVTTTAPVTVIPVPTLPTMQMSAQTSKLAPVVRAAQPAPAARRLGKGTAPIDQDATETQLQAAPEVDDTNPNLAIGDRTTPGIAMPLAARAVQLPSVKRRAAHRG
jgi:hypothetical protein